MYGNAVVVIPRERFWASEDGYAWDMDELTQATTSGRGVKKDSLSQELFVLADIISILGQPEEKWLQVLQVNQSQIVDYAIAFALDGEAFRVIYIYPLKWVHNLTD